jgi:hypothetical protein
MAKKKISKVEHVGKKRGKKRGKKHSKKHMLKK